MNNLLGIKMSFNHEPNLAKAGKRNLRKANTVDSAHLLSLISDLQRVKAYYHSADKFVDGILVDIVYNDIISKSGRIKELIKQHGDCNASIVGARFTDAQNGEENHIITHYVRESTIDDAISKLKIAVHFLQDELAGTATSDNFEYDNAAIQYEKYGLKKGKLRDVVIDSSVISSIDVPDAARVVDPKSQMVITFFNTEVQLSELLDRIGLNRDKYFFDFSGRNTISATLEAYTYLVNKAPYLISMATSDISQIGPIDALKGKKKEPRYIPAPKNEPTIGVIDMLFDDTVYFHEWVDYRETLDFWESQTKRDEYYNHGTAVSSIIVDGPSLNPWLDDGLGHFRVRHFGVCPGIISPTKLVKKIESIVQENQDIRVWNLSLGTNDEVSRNFISFDAAALDELQEKRNVIFVIAGTNDQREHRNGVIRVGSPADSLNGLVVNSVRRNGSPASYSRNGKILSFFNKPDVSYYGGDFEDEERMVVYTNNGVDKQYGTSFAAPWIARKMSYLIDVLGMSREIAKALIIDAAAGWEYKQETYKKQNIIGYGIVPKTMDGIISTDSSEIRFVVQGIANSYNTTNYAIPIPKDENGKCPYIARATLCYFPECCRSEGVDYTQRELSLKFGRIGAKGIIDINKNVQDVEGEYSTERKARKEFRKWENTKFISGIFKDSGLRAVSLYGEGLWGLSLTSKERRRYARQDNLSFGLVITVKHIKGVNKINEFRHACLLRGYIVNEINIQNQIDIYEKAQEEISFE